MTIKKQNSRYLDMACIFCTVKINNMKQSSYNDTNMDFSTMQITMNTGQNPETGKNAPNDPSKNDPTRIDPRTNDPGKVDPTRISPDTNDPNKVDPTHIPQQDPSPGPPPNPGPTKPGTPAPGTVAI